MEIIIASIISAVVSSIVTILIRRDYSKIVGKLRIDKSDPYDGPYVFLELFKGIGDISKRKYVTLEISTKSYLPQK